MVYVWHVCECACATPVWVLGLTCIDSIIVDINLYALVQLHEYIG